MTLDFVFFPGCPHAGAARRTLREAVDRIGHERGWTERDLHDADTPDRFRAYPSPTVLVDGQDVQDVRDGPVDPIGPTGGNACRVGEPLSVERLVHALRSCGGARS